MASVFEGRHPLLESRVALKLMHPALAADPRAAARFLREAKAAAQLRHQHVVEVFDLGTEAGVPFIVMEYLDGVDLAARIAEVGRLPLASITPVFLPIASAIQAAHSAGIIHRDLKPANVMLARRPPHAAQPVVLDFGISKWDDDSDALTRSGTVVGTLPYLAPELTNGARFASPASDQYSFSVMLYESATGQLPFQGDGPYALMHAIVNAELRPPSSHVAGLPPEFDALVLRGMQRDPAQRFSSMAELGAALLALAPPATFSLWSEQFDGRQIADAGKGETAFRTEPDVPRAGTLRFTPPPATLAKRRPNRLALSVTLLLGAYALVLTILLAQRWSTGRQSSPEAQALAASVAKAAHPPSASDPDAHTSHPSTPLEGVPLEGVPVSAARREDAPSEPAPIKTPRAAETRPTEVRSARHVQRPTPLDPNTSHPAASARPSETPADLGTNGAPIVE